VSACEAEAEAKAEAAAASIEGVNEEFARFEGILEPDPPQLPPPESSVEVDEVDLDRGRAFDDDFNPPPPPLEVILIGIFG
jgi:hypothetical protein